MHAATRPPAPGAPCAARPPCARRIGRVVPVTAAAVADGSPPSAQPPSSSTPPPPPSPPLSTLSAAYSATMNASMGSTLSYNHEAGMNWTPAPWGADLLVGSCPQSPADVARLAQAGVRSILSLQEPSDLEHFGIDADAIARAAAAAGVTLYRVPIRDFDPASLRDGLPRAVAVLEAALARGGAAYVHCTAGMGRAPAVALAHAAWVRGERLAEVAEALRAVRPCNPRLAAVRGAGADLVLGEGALVPTTLRIPASDLPPGTVSAAVAGLDVGWSGRLPLTKAEVRSEGGVGGGASFWSLTRPLPPGRHPFKLVVAVPGNSAAADPLWLTTPAYPVTDDGGHANNALDVAAPSGGVAGFTRHRLLHDELLPDEAAAAAAAVRVLAVEAVPVAERLGKPARRGLFAAVTTAIAWLVEVAEG